MSLIAHFEPIDAGAANRRGAPRLGLYLGSMLGPCGSRVVIHDLSFTGLHFESSADLNTGDVIEVHLPRIGPTKATIVRRDGSLFGCRFENAIARAAVSAALLRGEPPRVSNNQPEAGPSLVGQPGLGEPDQQEPPSALRRVSAVGVLALVVGGLAYIVMTAGAVALAWIAGAVAALLALLVWWGFWVIDNTLPG